MGYNYSGIKHKIDTGEHLEVPTIELGHATDTTIARVSAGVISIENANLLTSSYGEMYQYENTNIITIGYLLLIKPMQ